MPTYEFPVSARSFFWGFFFTPARFPARRVASHLGVALACCLALKPKPFHSNIAFLTA